MVHCYLKALELDYVNLSEDHLELLKCGIKKKSVSTRVFLYVTEVSLLGFAPESPKIFIIFLVGNFFAPYFRSRPAPREVAAAFAAARVIG